MNEEIKSLSDLFARGLIIPSEDFSPKKQPDGRTALALRAHLHASALPSGRARMPFVAQVVLQIHLSMIDAYGVTSISLSLDTSQINYGIDTLGGAVGVFELLALNLEHPYAKKNVMARWYGGVGFAVFVDSVKTHFPDLSTLVVTVSNPSGVPLTVNLVRGGNNQYESGSGDIINPTGEQLQSQTIAASELTITYNFATPGFSIS